MLRTLFIQVLQVRKQNRINLSNTLCFFVCSLLRSVTYC